MVDPLTLAIGALGMAGGGGTNVDQTVSQSSSNITGVNISSVLNNMGKAPVNANPTSGAQTSAPTSSAQPAPAAQSPLAFPNMGYKSIAARDQVASVANNGGTTPVFAIAAMAVAGGAALLFLGRGKKKGKK